MKKTILGLMALLLITGVPINIFSAEEDPIYTTLRTIDLGTYNEFRYRITEQFFALREDYQVNNSLSKEIITEIAVLADDAYKYLPDNLVNKNYLSELNIDLQRGVKYPSNESAYTEIIKGIADYLENVEIQSVSGVIEGTPLSGNAPLSTTLRAKVQDPTGTQIVDGNYTWWVDNAGERVVIGRGPSINYSFRQEGKFTVFLDVTSSHKNVEGFTDVLPFRERVDITVNEKIASLIIKVNNDNVSDNSILKFTPDEASYGLLFDATSSTPTSGTQFTQTQWDFGNGVTRTYNGGPKIERISYGTEGDYSVVLTMVTNEGKVVEKVFPVSIHDPIATIEVNREDGFIGDKFTFSAKTSGTFRDLTYSWEIVDIDADRIIHQKSDKVLTYAFTNKGKYNVKLKVRRASGEVDQDTRIVYVTSQAPIAEFSTETPFDNKPNRAFLDASRSFDPDITDDGNLKYDWYIDGARVKLEEANSNGSVGYFTFDSIGTHSINLEVTDLDGLTTIKKGSMEIDSILAIEMYAFPRVIQRNGFIRFVAESPEAELYEWDFGDGIQTGGSLDKITHTYEKSGAFDVKLTVSDANNNSNTYTRTVYVSESDTPFALVDVSFGTLEKPAYSSDACGGTGGYLIDRVNTIKFDGGESINIDGETSGLEYSWKIGNGKFATSSSVSHRFDEIGCFPVKLTVKSDKNSKTSSQEIMLDVRNVEPTMTSLRVTVENPDVDPLIVRVDALGAEDPDGVIQSYLWYYYTDTDSQPQDFRSTTTSATAFVIPKITGNYYFVGILKDNNEARVTSEEVTGARYFTTITGDNINTPIVDLEVNDNSTVIGEEIVFTAKAKNILGQEIEKDASFSWDFDGDGFYDTQTSTPVTSYKYRKSGEFYAKVKVKYRGISSTKNITVNVSNKLVADFEYISIGNKTIFFDSSNGQIDSRSWDLGDGNKKSGTNFEHTYTDGQVNHEVVLTITEGTKTKEVKKTVTKNIKNILKTRSGNLVVFTSPLVVDGKIVLENQGERAFVYMGESVDSAVSYGIDYDIEHDSDLNGGTDDDEDNKGTASYISGDVAEIPLSDFNIQTIRLFIKDADGNILGTQDIEIEKTYIEEKNIDPDTIIFEGVSESEREKIESLKESLLKLPQQQKLKALSFVQKLQENWNDNTEKTRTILDFENYIFELELSNEDELINILESLLVEGQEDQSAKQITYQALVNLVPEGIECEVESGTCYDTILSKLEDIRSSDDNEYNKALGTEILEVIGGSDLLTNTQKLDFKAILTSLVYGGDVADIPETEKQEIVAQGGNESINEGGVSTLGILLGILKWIGYFIILFLLVIAGFYILYLLVNKDASLSFSGFISNVTSFNKTQEDKNVEISPVEDILGDFDQAAGETNDVLSDPLASTSSEEKKPQEKQENTQKSSTQVKEEVPDWLKGNFSDSKTQPAETKVPQKKEAIATKKPENTTQEKPQIQEKKEITEKNPEGTFDLEKDTKIKTDENVPDWLKGSFDEPKKEALVEAKKAPATKEKKTEAPAKAKPETPPAAESKETKTESLTDENVPDWLKGSFDEPKKEAVADAKKAPVAKEKKTEAPLEQKPETPPAAESKEAKTGSLTDENVPDWLKGSFDEPKKEALVEAKKAPATKEKKTEAPAKAKSETSPAAEKKETKTELKKKAVEKKQEPKKKAETLVGEKASSQAKDAPKKAPLKKEKLETKDNASIKKDELWDDGMKVPDWLKADND